jgi:hypothetical protein
MKTHKGWTTFHQKRWCIISIIIHSKLKPWQYSLDILNTSNVLKKIHNILEPKVHFESKLILIQRLDEDDRIKLMYMHYITYKFSIAIGPLVCGSWNITQKKKIEKIMQCTFIKSPPLWYDNDIFPLK